MAPLRGEYSSYPRHHSHRVEGEDHRDLWPRHAASKGVLVVRHSQQRGHERPVVLVRIAAQERDKDAEVKVDRGFAPFWDVGRVDCRVQCRLKSAGLIELQLTF